MKKNNILKYILLPLLILSSCTIKEEPPFADKELIYAGDQGQKAVLDGLYAMLIEFPGYKQGFHETRQIHSGILNSRQASLQATVGSLNIDPTWNQNDFSWGNYYTLVYRANQLLVDIEVKETSTAYNIDVVGNALFLRAFSYFHLVRSWGEVPLITTPTNLETLYVGKSTKGEIYTQIIADLTLAAEYLSEGGLAPGYPKKYAAEMLLGKVYMWLASAEDSGEEDVLISGVQYETDTTSGTELTYWQSALAHASKVEGQYMLTSDYRTLFAGADGNHTEESIFEVNFNSEVAQVSYTALFTPNNWTKGLNNYGRIVVNPEVYASHQNTHENDPRFKGNFLGDYNGYSRNQSTGEIIIAPWGTNFKINDAGRLNLKTNQMGLGYAVLTKHMIKDREQTTLDSPKGFIIFRYADLLLMLAEIENELGNTSKAETYLAKILERARTSTYLNVNGDVQSGNGIDPILQPGQSQDEMRETIFQERIFELVGEGEDWYEVRRRGFAYFTSHVIEPHNNFIYFNEAIDVKLNTTNKGMLFPIPLSEIANNQALSEQNPGY
ncbi:RagB/SusD family nutrient uptake outer membrane protein [Flammeovirga pectinis]|uniref:RagB/SusD family nutrient uptake outer membrane protein n=1 Tax=Flammeovirga pectinis TaxID=2494373 RepID=A0A3Q9FS93_9BACT|nr:RagB/SusD family nutrient uptake outer membrane protein [Flammeovirga pectinis]AZQ64887.1 RagB/SusD family nutrient uptake outer membrane protein [Flammeovirga pectinis]